MLHSAMPVTLKYKDAIIFWCWCCCPMPQHADADAAAAMPLMMMLLFASLFFVFTWCILRCDTPLCWCLRLRRWWHAYAFARRFAFAAIFTLISPPPPPPCRVSLLIRFAIFDYLFSRLILMPLIVFTPFSFMPLSALFLSLLRHADAFLLLCFDIFDFHALSLMLSLISIFFGCHMLMLCFHFFSFFAFAAAFLSFSLLPFSDAICRFSDAAAFAFSPLFHFALPIFAAAILIAHDTYFLSFFLFRWCWYFHFHCCIDAFWCHISFIIFAFFLSPPAFADAALILCYAMLDFLLLSFCHAFMLFMLLMPFTPLRWCHAIAISPRHYDIYADALMPRLLFIFARWFYAWWLSLIFDAASLFDFRRFWCHYFYLLSYAMRFASYAAYYICRCLLWLMLITADIFFAATLSLPLSFLCLID